MYVRNPCSVFCRYSGSDIYNQVQIRVICSSAVRQEIGIVRYKKLCLTYVLVNVLVREICVSLVRNL